VPLGGAIRRGIAPYALICSINVATNIIEKWDFLMANLNVVRARIDTDLKNDATAVLSRMGLSVSDAIRMMLIRVAAEQKLPFDVKVPNAETQAAMRDADMGKTKRFSTVADLMADLESDDD
jgi:DNA-damage-inducible protein J